MAIGPIQSTVLGCAHPDLDESDGHVGQRPLRHPDPIAATWRGWRRSTLRPTARRIARGVGHRRVR